MPTNYIIWQTWLIPNFGLKTFLKWIVNQCSKALISISIKNIYIYIYTKNILSTWAPRPLALAPSLDKMKFSVCLRSWFSVCVYVSLGWSYETVHGPTKWWKMRGIIPMALFCNNKKYFVTVFLVISFQFSANKRYLNTPLIFYDEF